jgi:hypothetical protein
MATNESAVFKSCSDWRSFFDRKFDESLLIDFYLSSESLYPIYGIVYAKINVSVLFF